MEILSAQFYDWALYLKNNIINRLTAYCIVTIFCTDFEVGESIKNSERINVVGVLVFYSIK